MPATFTASDTAATPRALHTGETVVRATYTANGVTMSLSDVILAVKVPNGAFITDGYFSGTDGAAASVYKVGVTGADTALHTGATLSATSQLQRFNGLSLPHKVSLSDDAVPQWQWVIMTKVSGTSTVTASIQLVVRYATGGALA